MALIDSLKKTLEQLVINNDPYSFDRALLDALPPYKITKDIPPLPNSKNIKLALRIKGGFLALTKDNELIIYHQNGSSGSVKIIFDRKDIKYLKKFLKEV